jgi:phage/plasmid-associated DNA primase
MTTDIDMHKGALLVGPPRCGKGTTLGVAEALVGPEAYVGVDINNWMQGENSGERLIGKKVIAFPDVRLKPPRWYGTRFDAGGISHVSQTKLLEITGGDAISLGRKWKGEPWKGRLPGKI